jgi:hypothetical protein
MFRWLAMLAHTSVGVEREAELVEVCRELAHAAVIVAAMANETRALNGPKPLSARTRRPDDEWVSKIAPPSAPQRLGRIRLIALTGRWDRPSP